MTNQWSGFPPEVQQQLEELRRQSDALPRPRVLDAATLRGIKDEDLDFAIGWYVGEAMRSSDLDREDVLADESETLRVFYLALLLEAEVLNGGFNQYFWNVSPTLVSMTAAALQRIGANRSADVFRAATTLADAEAQMRRGYKSEGTLQGFSDSYEHTRLAPLDDAFAEVTSELKARRIAFVRANETAFLKPAH